MGRVFIGLFLLPVVFAVAGCAGGKRLALVEKEKIAAQVAAGSLEDVDSESYAVDTTSVPEIVEVSDLRGNSIVMNAVKDEESGEMVALEQLDEIVVVAKFKHVAERNGSVDLVFELSVPIELQQKRWQVRFTPQYFVLEDTVQAEKIFITGERFRRVQNWEYAMYGNYARKIVPGEVADTLYSRRKLLGRFMERGAWKNYGGSREELERSASRHYRKRLMEKMNINRADARMEIFNRFVVDPFPDGGVRLDSVVYDRSIDGLRYYYVQSIKTRPGLKRVDMVMQGEIYTNGKKLCNLQGLKRIIKRGIVRKKCHVQ